MHKIALFYFSGTGNTWWASEELTRLLREKGAAAEAFSIEKITPGEAGILIKEASIAGFGYPIYGSDLPQPVKNFILGLPAAKNKKCFVFCTQWLWSGDGARTGAGFLRPKGFDVRWGEHFLMPLNVCVPVLPFFLFTNDRTKIDAVLGRASLRIERFAAKIVSGQPFRRGFNPVSFSLGCMQRVPYRIVYSRLQDDISVDRERCTSCGLCTRLCPSGNLAFDGKAFSTRGNCYLCLRCYNFCPVSAIKYMHRQHNLRRGEPYRGPVKDFNPGILCARGTELLTHMPGQFC